MEPQIHASPAGDGTSRPVHGDGVLEQLFARHSERIFRYCLREFGSREEAEDALQDTYVNALRSLRRGFEPQAPLAWLLTIAGNVCRSRRRSERARVRTEPLERLGDVASSEEPWNDEVAAISDALCRLPEMQRRAVLLREWRGLSYDEIADELSLSHSAVATQISRARRALSSFVLHPVRDRLGSFAAVDLLAWLRESLAAAGAAKMAAGVAVVGAVTVATPAARHAQQPPERGAACGAAAPAARPRTRPERRRLRVALA